MFSRIEPTIMYFFKARLCFRPSVTSFPCMIQHKKKHNNARQHSQRMCQIKLENDAATKQERI